MYADLHLHTTASDGSFRPAEVVALAEGKGFAVISITDHDTVDGLEEALQEGQKRGIEVIPGIELSTLYGDLEVHILGYYIDREDKQLRSLLRRFIESRKTRAFKMIEKLNEMGIDITAERVKELAGSEFVGRPHIAKAMVEKGYISEVSEAFTEDYIGRGGRAYVERFKLSPEEAIGLILDIGGVPVLAHPGYLSSGESLDDGMIGRFVESGLKGIEVFYSKHTEKQTQYYMDIAKRYRLLVTGGSDCHGHNGDGILMGTIKLSCGYVKALKEEWGKHSVKSC